MKAPHSTAAHAAHAALPSDLLTRCPLALEQVEIRLFILALGCLSRGAQGLTFELAFEHVMPNGDEDEEGRYARLEQAQRRLTQPLKYETLRSGKRYGHYIPLFLQMSIDQDTGLVTGLFNPHLQAYLLELSSKFAPAELESLLRLRQ